MDDVRYGYSLINHVNMSDFLRNKVTQNTAFLDVRNGHLILF